MSDPEFKPDLLEIAETFPNFIREHADFQATGKVLNSHRYYWKYAVDQKRNFKVVMQEFREPLDRVIIRRYYAAVYALAVCNFPNIVEFVGFTVEKPYTVIYKDPGGTHLNSVIDRDLKKSPPHGTTMAKLVLGIAAALNHIHSHGIIFRNLSPMTVMLDDQMCPFIADFTECLIVRRGAKFESQCGSIQFAAPEMVNGDETYTDAVDVWAFGMLLWCIGECDSRPYGDLSGSVLVKQVAKDKKKPGFKKSPPALRTMIQNCWQADAKKRPTFEQIIASIGEDPMFKDADVKSVRYLLSLLVRTQTSNAATPVRPPAPQSNAEALLQKMRMVKMAKVAEIQAKKKAKPHMESDATQDTWSTDSTSPLAAPMKLNEAISTMNTANFPAWFQTVVAKLKPNNQNCANVIDAIHKMINRNADLLEVVADHGFFSMTVLANLSFAAYSFSFLVHLVTKRPGLIHPDMRQVVAFNVRENPEECAILFGYFLADLGRHRNAIGFAQMIFEFGQFFIDIPVARKLIIPAYNAVVQFSKIRTDNPEAVGDFFSGFLRSSIMDTLTTIYPVLLSIGPDEYFELPFDCIVQHFNNQELQWQAVTLLARVPRLPPNDEFLFGALYAAAQYSLIGFTGLVKLAESAESAVELFIKFTVWMQTPIPTFKENYRLILALFRYPSCRSALSHTEDFGRILKEVISTGDKEYITSFAALLKRSELDSVSFGYLESSGFLRALFDLGINTNDDEIALTVLVCMNNLGVVNWSDMYLEFVPRMMDMIGKQDSLAIAAIQEFVQLSEFFRATACLREQQMDNYFRNLAAVPGYETIAATFLGNLDNPRR